MESRKREDSPLSYKRWKPQYDSCRKYNSKWEETFPWVKKAQGMDRAYCEFCHCHIILKASSLASHEKSRKHQQRVPPGGYFPLRHDSIKTDSREAVSTDNDDAKPPQQNSEINSKNPNAKRSARLQTSNSKYASAPKKPCTFFSTNSHSEMPEDMVRIMEEANEKSGFVPNSFKALSHRPNEMRVFLNYYDLVMEDRRGGHLTKVDKEMIFVAVSAFNKSKYFTIAHSGLFRIFSRNKTLAEQIVTNWKTADLDERQRAILQFAMKVTKCKELFEEDFRALEVNGIDREDAWDIGSVVSFCSLCNRMACLTNMSPNEQFYSLGRTDKKEK